MSEVREVRLREDAEKVELSIRNEQETEVDCLQASKEGPVEVRKVETMACEASREDWLGNKIGETQHKEKRKRGRKSLDGCREGKSGGNRKLTELWRNERQEVEDLEDRELKQSMKKIDSKKTPQRGDGDMKERNGVQKEEKQTEGVLRTVLKRIEGVKYEIMQEREGLESEINKEIKGLADRIEVIESRWRNKEEQLCNKMEEMLRKLEEQHKEERVRREIEKKELLAEVLQRVEEKIKRVEKKKEKSNAMSLDEQVQGEIRVIKKKLVE